MKKVIASFKKMSLEKVKFFTYVWEVMDSGKPFEHIEEMGKQEIIDYMMKEIIWSELKEHEIMRMFSVFEDEESWDEYLNRKLV